MSRTSRPTLCKKRKGWGTNHEGLNTSAGTNNQLAGFGYDPAGNMTSNSPSTYKYDAENRLVTPGSYTYYYDGDGNRVEKSGGSGTLYWRGPGGDPISESSLTGSSQEEYIFFNGQRVARRDVTGNAVHYYFSDHLGSHGVVENATGSACEQDIDYYPYGGVVYDYCGTVTQHYRFTGKERDSESGLDNFGARYDASSMGRFMTPDPLLSSGGPGNPQTWNRYAYGLNNPLRIVDPTGLWDWDESAGGDSSDDDLQGIANDKRNKRHKWAKKALQFRENFRKGLDAADDAAGSSQLSDDEQSAAQAAVDAYGSEGDDNGVTVGLQNGNGATTLLNDNDTFSVKFGSGDIGNFLAATILHEGVHIDQGNAWLNGGESSVADINHYFREQHAWTLEGSVAMALGMNSLAPHGGGPEYQVWNKGWKAADIETMRSRGVANIMNYMNLKPTDTDTYSNEHQHEDQ